MAGSYPYFKEDVAKYLKENFKTDATILDIGAGNGSYYDYLHDYFTNMEAVEVFEPNIKEYQLEEKYKKVYNVNIKDFEYEHYDIIIFGDVLEHLNVEDAQRVLDYALDRCEEVIVAVPYMYVQDEIYGNKYEIHLQPDLTKQNMFERYPRLKYLIGCDAYGYYIKKR